MSYDKLVPFKLPPGYYNNGTDYQAKGRWTSGNLVRFFLDTIQPIGGWVARTLTGTGILGVPRASIVWTPDIVGENTEQKIAVGTTQGLFIIKGSVIYNITPTSSPPPTDTTAFWEVDTFGSYLVATRVANPLNTASINFYGPYVWEGDVATPAKLISALAGAQAPAAYPYSLVVTPERFLFLLGGWDPRGPFAIGGPNPPQTRRIFWADQESLTVWIPTDTNAAGDFELSTQGTLVCGRAIRGGTLLFTTTEVHLARYVGAPVIYSFDRLADDCGIVSTKAHASAASVVYWMGVNGFFRYDGFVKPIPCEVQDYVFGDFNRTYAWKVWALSNPNFNEITWFYPSSGSTEIDRYVTFCYTEGMEHFTFGQMARTTGISKQPPGMVPVMFAASSTVYDHETGSLYSGVTPYAESGPLEIGDGDNLVSLLKVLPDDKTVGDVNLSVFTSMGPDFAETENGPYTLAAQTSIRLKARQMRFKLSQVVATAWRVGVIRFGITQSSRR